MTEIEIVQDFEGSRFSIGDRGYVSGYKNSKNKFSEALVVINVITDAVPVYCIKPIKADE